MSKRKPPDEDVQLSKAMSKLLRHDAMSANVAISQDGWVLVSDALDYLNQRRPRQPWSEEAVARVVTGNDKQRFALRKRNDGCSEIRANQGHSMQSISVDMVRLSSATAPPMALHGTYHRAWPLIRTGGLSKMNRQHVHMARALPGESGVPAWSNAALGRVPLLRLMFTRPLTRDQAPGRPQLPPKVTDPAAFGVNSGVISGMRASCDIVVRVDVVAAIAAGMIFYESANGVLLSEGFDGVIPPRFFTGAEERKTGESLDLAELAPPLEADGDVPAADGVGGGGGMSAG